MKKIDKTNERSILKVHPRSIGRGLRRKEGGNEMKKLWIVTGLVLVLLVSWGLITPRKSEAMDPLTLFGFSITIGFVGGSLYNYNKYPECRKEESIGDMGECVMKAQQDRKEKKERIRDEIQK